MAKHIAGWADRVLRSGAHEAAKGNGHRNASSSDLRSLDASPGSLFLLGSLVLGEICRVLVSLASEDFQFFDMFILFDWGGHDEANRPRRMDLHHKCGRVNGAHSLHRNMRFRSTWDTAA
jgi:hypothetical protein